MCEETSVPHRVRKTCGRTGVWVQECECYRTRVRMRTNVERVVGELS